MKEIKLFDDFEILRIVSIFFFPLVAPSCLFLGIFLGGGCLQVGSKCKCSTFQVHAGDNYQSALLFQREWCVRCHFGGCKARKGGGGLFGVSIFTVCATVCV